MHHTRRSFHCLITLSAFGTLAYFILTRTPKECHLHPPKRDLTERPLVFVGGHPRSGTTLLRVLLDVHPKIRCGAETHVLSRILSLYRAVNTGSLTKRLEAAHLYPAVINGAFAAFISHVIENAGEDAEVLCNKDPLALQYGSILHKLYPKAKFIHIVRDGRAVTASMHKRKVRIGKQTVDIYETFARWERIVKILLDECVKIAACLTIQYEQLVLQPRRTMSKVLDFLQLPWHESVLNHHMLIKNGTILSKLEPSTSQVVYPIHLEALYSWAANDSVLSYDFIHNIHERSEILKSLGYAQSRVPPDYGIPEPMILERAAHMSKDAHFRKIFG